MTCLPCLCTTTDENSRHSRGNELLEKVDVLTLYTVPPCHQDEDATLRPRKRLTLSPFSGINALKTCARILKSGKNRGPGT